MKKDNRGETAKPIPGVVNNPKATPNHKSIPNTVSSSKDAENRKIPGSSGPDVKK